MSLYDGLGLDSKENSQREQKSDLGGWSSSIKLLQSQLQRKKAALTQVKAQRDIARKGAVLAPVVDLKSRKDDEMPPPPAISFAHNRESKGNSTASLLGGEWDVRLEYDPQWPNDYEKIMRERRERKDEDKKKENEERNSYKKRRNDRSEVKELDIRIKEEEMEEEMEMNRLQRTSKAGAAIAPPPSLMEPMERKENVAQSITSGLIPSLGGSVAARIMAKYGFKEGQGLGKLEQGMSQALQVEKTSKRGGKIIHERDIVKRKGFHQQIDDEDEMDMPPPSFAISADEKSAQNMPAPLESITEIMKNPSKVVLLRNMVGPGEVDEELEPETKEECGKYGEVNRCVIFEIPGGNVSDEESVRIFIEFKRMESAIKAVVDLNGRYFGGRVVKAGFYDPDRFKRLELGD